MAYEKLSRRALGCMYTAEIIGDVIFIVLIGIVNIFWLIPKQIEIGRWISAVLLIYAAVSMLVEPYSVITDIDTVLMRNVLIYGKGISL